MLQDTVKTTPLAEAAEKDGPTWVDFAGFRMPVQFEGIVAEHMAVRRHAGLFDISHMGRLMVRGEGAGEALDRLLTRRVSDMTLSAIRYSFIVDAEGNILDDLMVARRRDAWQLIVNAVNRERVITHMENEGYGHLLEDLTFETAMLALQGPASAELLERVWPEADAITRRRYHLWCMPRNGRVMCGSRSGYTGSDGYEIHGPPEAVSALWTDLREAGAAPCGLGSRDSLRNEAALPLYGHELNEQSSPWELGLAYSVDLSKDFVGSEEFRRRHDAGISRMRVGLVLTGRRIARENMAVYDGDVQIGCITSGTWSPLREAPIAQAMLDVAHAMEGRPVTIDIRGRRERATVVGLKSLLPRS
ncbi:MAG: glycine cleavage system aminomethyltransferase GcvT [Planctomycetes bacterium]|nr:glycine cleavage system aminomethyltransferase GcvT [Planctomycetota bacterium]